MTRLFALFDALHLTWSAMKAHLIKWIIPPRPQGERVITIAPSLLRCHQPTLLLFHGDLQGDADGVFGVGFGY